MSDGNDYYSVDSQKKNDEELNTESQFQEDNGSIERETMNSKVAQSPKKKTEDDESIEPQPQEEEMSSKAVDSEVENELQEQETSSKVEDSQKKTNEGEVDFAWFERQYEDEEMSSKFAAQRDEESEDDELSEEGLQKFGSADVTLPEAIRVVRPVEGSEPLMAAKSEPAMLKAQEKVSEQTLKAKPTKGFHDCFVRYPLLRGKQVSITLSKGERVFCAIQALTKTTVFVPEDDSKLKSAIDSKTFSRIENDVEVKVAVERRMKEAIESSTVPIVRKPIPVLNLEKSSRLPLVQRFKPERFIDLLSHEKRNRDALKWLRSWDKQQPPGAQPIPKILLLSGPPGSGKTTLAHVLAHHAGYRVVEINASDERNGANLKERLASATEMKSVFDMTGRYNLVVLDEIDGIADGIQAVVNYATDSSNSRPLICTCNDAYAPSLRPLRRLAMIITVNQPGRPRLVKRLKEICSLEHIDQRPGALELLAMRMENDMRACLNALDFWARSSSDKPVLDVEAIKRLPAFAKDSSADLWSTWKQILTMKKEADTLNVLSRQIADVSIVMDGIHENFPRMKYMDTGFRKTLNACEWLCFVDVMQTRTMREMDFSFQSYCSLGCLGVGNSIAASNSTSTKIVFPTSAATFRQTKTRNEESLREFFSKPETYQMWSKRHFASEGSLSLLTSMLRPKVRPVPIQAMSQIETDEIDRVVEMMNYCGLVWMLEQQMWTLDPPIDKLNKYNQTELVSTEIIRAVNSKLKKRQQHVRDEEGFKRVSVSPSSLADPKRAKNDISPLTDSKRSKLTLPDTLNSVEEASSSPNALTLAETGFSDTVSIKRLKVDERHAAAIPVGMKKDFFGRIVACAAPSNNMETNKLSASDQSRSDFTFRFNEGLTDAVKRVVKMQDLL